MSVAHFVDFEWTGRGGELRLDDWKERRKFYASLFDAGNRQNGQPTTLNIIFNPPPKKKSNHQTSKIQQKISV